MGATSARARPGRKRIRAFFASIGTFPHPAPAAIACTEPFVQPQQPQSSLIQRLSLTIWGLFTVLLLFLQNAVFRGARVLPCARELFDRSKQAPE